MSQQYRSAVHLFFFDQGKTLLSLRCNTGYMDGFYSVVAGHLEPGETVVQAAIREAAEEIGVQIDPQDVEIVQVMHRKDGEERIDFFVHIHAWTGTIHNAEEEKCAGLAWFSPDALPENTVPYVRRALQNYEAKRWMDTFGWEDEAD